MKPLVLASLFLSVFISGISVGMSVSIMIHLKEERVHADAAVPYACDRGVCNKGRWNWLEINHNDGKLMTDRSRTEYAACEKVCR